MIPLYQWQLQQDFVKQLFLILQLIIPIFTLVILILKFYVLYLFILFNNYFIPLIECWNSEPTSRPITSQIVKTLKEIIFKTNPIPIDNNHHNHSVNNQILHKVSIFEPSLSMEFITFQLQNFNNFK